MSRSVWIRRLFTGDTWVDDALLTIDRESGIILSLSSPSPMPEEENSAIQCIHCCAAPALIDLQIYGAGGQLFSLYPTVETLKLMYEHCLQGGTAYFQPTIASNAVSVIVAGIEAVREYWEAGGKGCLGLHLEGPWISLAKRGAHLPEHIQEWPSFAAVQTLLERGRGIITFVTLAPEIISPPLMAYLATRKEDITFSLGHSNATYEQAMDALATGTLRCATHLFNAMPPLHHRQPGCIAAICNTPQPVYASIIADGWHVAWPMLSVARRLLPTRLFLITDAVTATDTGPYPHQLSAGGDRYESAGVLSGSALTLWQAVVNVVEQTGCGVEEALRMGSLYPASAVQQDSKLGRIVVGARADLLCFKWEEGDEGTQASQNLQLEQVLVFTN
jgi:N-acetylglucosamine-6-phosphate deacetylase